MMFRLALTIAIVTALTMTACDDDPASVGLSIDTDSGSVAIYAALCDPGARVSAVVLRAADSGDVFWEIRSSDGTREAVFIAAYPPPGFDVIVPYSPPASETVVRGEVHIADGQDEYVLTEEYPLEGLLVGRVRVHGDQLVPGDWPKHVTEFCSPDRGLFR